MLSCRSDRQRISFNEHIRPMLNAKCVACHGGVRRNGGLSLLFRQDALSAGESGNIAIVPGRPGESELIRRIKNPDPELRMPKDGHALSEAEIERFTQWIREGAEWEDHWAYLAPQPVDLPVVDTDWPRNGIDRFTWAKMQEAGFAPAAEADKSTLARRVSLDLTGLPPRPEALRAFLENEAPDAFESFIDSLLAAPQFGERWAAMWLDLARYADTQGYEKDPYRSIWKYRDWVIKAFNRDLPFDQFTMEQLAGDLIPDPAEEQLIATAFHRNSMTNTEGGTEDEEYRIAAVVDRINTTFDIWQGTTIGCAQCHGHPYDPFTQKEYYQLMAFFNNTQDADLGNEFPNIRHYKKPEAERIEELIGYIKKLQPHRAIDQNAPLSTRIRQALFPRLFPLDCDDMQNVVMWGNTLSNWSNNVNNLNKKKYYFKYDDIDLAGLQEIEYEYSSKGDDALIEVRLDSVGGRLISSAPLKKTEGNPDAKKDRMSLRFPVRSETGKHDLIFSIINTTGKIPEGTAIVSEISLYYEGRPQPSPKVKSLQDSLLVLQSKAIKTPVMKERSEALRRKTYVFDRGNYLLETEEVQPGVPASLPPLSADGESSRLDLAKWLLSPENPLTARVIVNRFWEQLFGIGIIETLEDFGTQGMEPSHPELLDYLALRFSNELKWSVKALLKEIVSSATYRQSSVVSDEKLKKDPYNRFLARGPRVRLSAEQIRDQALAVSDLLSDKMYGPSVMPPQPEGIWAAVYDNAQWETSEGPDRYRRGIYTYWRRTSPYPSMVSFDTPSREFCVSRRIRTNTPLQALITLNDPVYVEAATALAVKMTETGRGDLSNSIAYGYQRAIGKAPDQATVQALSDLYSKAMIELKPLRAELIAEKEGADLSPMAVVANAIMNLDAFIMKE